jgi:hypothetical protein
MNSTQWAFEYIHNRLRIKNIKQGSLSDEDINDGLIFFKNTLEKSFKNNDTDTLSFIFDSVSYKDYKTLKETEWEGILRALKSSFNTSWNPEVKIITGEEHRKRDNTWWTDRVKADKNLNKNFYWKEYKEFFLEKEFNRNIVLKLENLVDNILNNLGNPQDDNFDRYGMVVGHVQSGKTGNYSSLICKAADAGYKFIVVLSGTNINNLRNQTQQRINEAFIGTNDKKEKCGIGIGHNRDLKDIPLSLTTDTADFTIKSAQTMIGVNFETMNVPIVLVIKKNATVLKNLTNWLQDQYKDVISEHPILVIDDESDYASVNTKVDSAPARINGLIRSLLFLFNKSSYVAYTATPFANIFIDYKAENEEFGKDLFPKDFIFPIDAPSNYVGASKIFGSNAHDENENNNDNFLRNNFLVDIDDNEPQPLPIKHRKDFDLVGLPDSLYDAIRVFILNVAIRNLRGHNETKHNTMLIHVTLYTLMHESVHSFVEEYLTEIKDDISNFGNSKNYKQQGDHFNELKNSFNNHVKNIDLEFTWGEVLRSLNECVDKIITRQVHSNKQVAQLEYLNSNPINVIVVGGLSLSRGFTLEGLSVSYFLRGTKFYDTLMQMGRWFGYRDGYEDLCRIYMTSTMQDYYKHIQEVTIDLFDSFKLMFDQKKTPYDFGLAVKEHPDNVLQVTAKNKMRNTLRQFITMDLRGQIKETARLSKDKNILEGNLLCIKNLVKKINTEYKYISIPSTKSNSLLWKNIEGKIISNFLNEFQVEGASQFILSSRMPIDFVQEFVRDNPDSWDVAVYSGKGSIYEITDGIKINAEERKINSKGNYQEVGQRQVSSGNSESINLPEEIRKELGAQRKITRAEPNRNNLLMLHILQDKVETSNMIAAFGVSFSGDGINGKSTRIRMNQVMIDEINNLANEETKELEDEE